MKNIWCIFARKKSSNSLISYSLSCSKSLFPTKPLLFSYVNPTFESNVSIYFSLQIQLVLSYHTSFIAHSIQQMQNNIFAHCPKTSQLSHLNLLCYNERGCHDFEKLQIAFENSRIAGKLQLFSSPPTPAHTSSHFFFACVAGDYVVNDLETDLGLILNVILKEQP